MSIFNFSAKLRQKKLIEDKEKALVSSKTFDEKLMLDQLAENGVHLSKLESIQHPDSEHDCLWVCPGNHILILQWGFELRMSLVFRAEVSLGKEHSCRAKEGVRVIILCVWSGCVGGLHCKLVPAACVNMLVWQCMSVCGAG